MRTLEQQWQRRLGWHLLLLPLSVLFVALVTARRALYRIGVLRSERLPVPVIVIGNITVGGAGKTPLVLWLSESLRLAGYHPGIVSRGHGGRAIVPTRVESNGDAKELGDEPVLLAQRSGAPVWIGRDRVAVARALLSAHPECDVLVSDDGLQQYRLQRDIEIAVVDGDRQFGNGWTLPAGPLREPASRLRSVDVVIVNTLARSALAVWPEAHRLRVDPMTMRLTGRVFYRLHSPDLRATAADLQGKRLHAIAGIGHPERFFSHLRALGLTFEQHPFPDHYAYKAEDLQFEPGNVILMTEKDAVKCSHFPIAEGWVLPVAAQPEPAFAALLLQKLRKIYGPQAA